MKKVHVHIHRTRDADLTALKTKRNKVDSEIVKTQRRNANDSADETSLYKGYEITKKNDTYYISKGGKKSPGYWDTLNSARIAIDKGFVTLDAAPFNKGDTVKINAPGLPGHAKSGKILGMSGDHYQIQSGPEDFKNWMHPASRLTLVKKG